jgi:hypothetical protein
MAGDCGLDDEQESKTRNVVRNSPKRMGCYLWSSEIPRNRNPEM